MICAMVDVSSSHYTSSPAKAEAHLILDVLDACPAGEDEGVVRGEDSDDVDAFGLEGVVVLEVGREVVRVARRLQRPQCALV